MKKVLKTVWWMICESSRHTGKPKWWFAIRPTKVYEFFRDARAYHGLEKYGFHWRTM